MTRSDSPTLGTLHAAIAGLSPLRSSVLAFVCGVITIFAFAPFFLWPVYILSISLLIWLLDGAKTRKKWRKAMFFRGWAFGAGFTLASMHWLVSPFLVDPAAHIWFIWMPLILMPAGLGLFFGGASFLAGLVWSKTPGRIFAFAVTFSLFEGLRGTIFGGFPWNWPGMVWAPGEPVSQLASIFGLWGLSILTLLLAGAPAALADFRPHGGAFNRVFPLLIAAIVFGCGWAWGTQRIPMRTETDGIAVRIVDVQVDQTDKYPVAPDRNPEETRRLQYQAIEDIRAAYLVGTGDDFPDEPRLIVWPESALPVPLLQNPDSLDDVTLRLGSRTLITGTTRVDRYTSSGSDWYNSLAVLDEGSRFTGANAIYDKHRLVPFGELAAADFIPFGTQISGILPPALQQQAKAGYRPGPPASPIELAGGKTFLPLICYEALFPGLVRATVQNADFLVNISIDSWFGSGIGPDQHYAQARYRSIESGRPMVRAANLGHSGAIDSFGNEVFSNKNLLTYKSYNLTVTDTLIPDQKHITTYGRYGPLFSWLTVLLLTMFTYFYSKKT
ncbi:MAG: apolipoprotein N-acyltransferase [Ponticaulis sp.]|nr:apolipoprotein N-acyltransferase [Ponticaulis sp.]